MEFCKQQSPSGGWCQTRAVCSHFNVIWLEKDTGIWVLELEKFYRKEIPKVQIEAVKVGLAEGRSTLLWLSPDHLV